MAVIHFEPIAAKLRGLVPLSRLLPVDQVAATRQRILDGAGRGEAPMQPETLEFLAGYMTLTQAASVLMSLPPFRAVADQYERLEDEFSSGGPPKSPIYDSYSMMHALVEIPVGVASETPMGVMARLTAGSEVHRVLHELAVELAQSHLDFYRAIECEGTTATLVHVRSGQEMRVLLTGPFLRNSDLFLGRVVRSATGKYFIVESPYVLHTAESEYLRYLERKVHAVSAPPSDDKARFKGAGQKRRSKVFGGHDDREVRVRRFLRQGDNARYWPEFIFNAYSGERNGIVALVGVPDRPETQPQHERFDESTFVPDRVALAESVPPLERLRMKLDVLVEVNHVWESHAAVIAAHVAPLHLDLKEPRYRSLFRAFCCYGAPDEQGSTLLSVCAASGKLSAEEQSLAAALERGWFSLFEVRRVHLDESLEVFDLLRRKRLTILEKSATRGVALMERPGCVDSGRGEWGLSFRGWFASVEGARRSSGSRRREGRPRRDARPVQEHRVHEATWALGPRSDLWNPSLRARAMRCAPRQGLSSPSAVAECRCRERSP
ncbi:MAG: hypothetical protein QM784_27765 [Polyangiaceae bacterium]